LSEAKTQDGVEGSMSVSDPATGELLTIILFRDQGALDAYQAFANEKIAEAKDVGFDVPAPAGRVYSEVIAFL
jgi:hypothetical protein